MQVFGFCFPGADEEQTGCRQLREGKQNLWEQRSRELRAGLGAAGRCSAPSLQLLLAAPATLHQEALHRAALGLLPWL